MVDFIGRHAEKIAGVLSCLDRVVITGTLPDICHADAATGYLFNHTIRIFDYTKFAEPLRDRIRSHAEKLASDHGLAIEFLRNHDVRKEDQIQEILAHRGRHPGLVHIFSAMEPCPSFQPWHDKATGKTFLKYKTGSASTTTSTSSTRCSACATSACRPGRRSGSSAPSTGTTSWPTGSTVKASAIG